MINNLKSIYAIITEISTKNLYGVKAHSAVRIMGGSCAGDRNASKHWIASYCIALLPPTGTLQYLLLVTEHSIAYLKYYGKLFLYVHGIKCENCS